MEMEGKGTEGERGRRRIIMMEGEGGNRRKYEGAGGDVMGSGGQERGIDLPRSPV